VEAHDAAHYSRFGGGARARGADPEWATVIASMRRIQASAAIGLRVEGEQGREHTVLVLHRNDATPEIKADMRTLRRLLHIREDAREIRVVYGSVPKHDNELALVTRSMLEILIDLASTIEVPADDVSEGVVPDVKRFEGEPAEGYRPLIRIHSGPGEPEHAFVAVRTTGTGSGSTIATILRKDSFPS
jgi:hypothetical protein